MSRAAVIGWVLACLWAGPALASTPVAGDAGPSAAVTRFWDAARDGDVAAARGLMTARTVELADGVSRVAREIQATIVPDNMLEAWLGSLDAQRPELLGENVDGERAVVDLRYKRGQRARLDLRFEDGAWKLDFEQHFSRALEMLEEAEFRLGAARRGELVDDDDD